MKNNYNLKIYKNLISENISEFSKLIFFLIIEILIFVSSLIAIIPIADLIFNPELSNPSKVTKFLIDIFLLLDLKFNLKIFLTIFFILEISKIFISMFIVKKILDLRYSLHEKLFNKLSLKVINSNFIFFEIFDQGKLLNTLSVLIKKISAAYASLGKQIANIIKFFALIFVPLFINYKLVIISILIIGLIFIPIRYLSSTSYKLGTKVVRISNSFSKKILETLFASKLITIFLNQKYQFNKLKENLNYFNYFDKKSLLVNALIINSYRPLSVIALLSAYLIYNAYFNDEAKISEIAAVFWGLFSAAPVLGVVLNDFVETSNLLPNLQQYNHIYKKAETLQLKYLKNQSKDFNFSKNIFFKNILFSYDKKNKVLNKKNIIIKKNKTTIITGKSGSGKSTFLDLLLGYKQPQNGQVLIDGKKIKSLLNENYLKHVGYVPQEPFMFNTSIKNNLLWAKGNSKDSDLYFALQQANAKNFVIKLNKKLNYDVGENGSKLSGGQKQRICLARAILNNPQILILDEPVSSLDSNSKIKFKKALNSFKGKKKIFIVKNDDLKGYKYEKIIKI